mmetsp:Transcript_51453/g.120657  ORF Transcript_51453/g.120657 Transcript_51453/m.120657 type:complete len:89 (+) Transcript_51453:483-749(+)
MPMRRRTLHKRLSKLPDVALRMSGMILWTRSTLCSYRNAGTLSSDFVYLAHKRRRSSNLPEVALQISRMSLVGDTVQFVSAAAETQAR